MENNEKQEMNEERAYKILSERLEKFLLTSDKSTGAGIHITAELIFNKHGINVSMYSEKKERHHTI